MKSFTFAPLATAPVAVMRSVIILAVVTVGGLANTTAAATEFDTTSYVEQQAPAKTSQPELVNLNDRAQPASSIAPGSIVYAANLLQNAAYKFAAGQSANRWQSRNREDWQVSVKMHKTGTPADITRWAMVRYTRAIW